ncbi:hypothetical protein RBSH_04452 [Rhodopirellula baltica SH28]|uniref:Uncharacterized protein n=1 Tax=Rhodopirellula baltica SH28 TaxID=993517 RepID=K5E2V3_RHOBT|nr:hypothetical protein RBSH_04452 [Rhodopirellula baltica SH28]
MWCFEEQIVCAVLREHRVSKLHPRKRAPAADAEPLAPRRVMSN